MRRIRTHLLRDRKLDPARVHDIEHDGVYFPGVVGPHLCSPSRQRSTTPSGMSVCSAMSRPMNVAEYGVSGAGLSTTVQPATRAGASLAVTWWSG